MIDRSAYPLKVTRGGCSAADGDDHDDPSQPGRKVMPPPLSQVLQSEVERNGQSERTCRADRPGHVAEPVEPSTAEDLPEQGRGRKPDYQGRDGDLRSGKKSPPPDARFGGLQRVLGIEHAVHQPAGRLAYQQRLLSLITRGIVVEVLQVAQQPERPRLVGNRAVDVGRDAAALGAMTVDWLTLRVVAIFPGVGVERSRYRIGRVEDVDPVKVLREHLFLRIGRHDDGPDRMELAD